MNWRAIGCLGVGIVAFVGIGVLGLSMATSGTGCPARLAWQDETWEPDGAPGAVARIGDGDESPVEIGTVLIGMTSRRVYGPSGSAPIAGGTDDLPAEVALECGDGTFQGYRAAVDRGAPPSAAR